MTIVNAPLPKVQVSVADAYAAEVIQPVMIAEPVRDPGVFTVSRMGETEEPLTVFFNWSSGTANLDSDFTVESLDGNYSVTIPEGQSSVSVTIVPILDSLNHEGVETAVLTIASGVAYSIDPSSPSGTVLIHDKPLPLLSISATDAQATEPSSNGMSGMGDSTSDSGLFTITRSGESTAAFDVSVTFSGSALYGTDYSLATTSTQTVHFDAGQNSAQIEVVGIHDLNYEEGDETIIATINPGNDYDVSTQEDATVTLHDGTKPLVSILTTIDQVVEPAGFMNMTSGEFTLSRTGDVMQELTVTYTVTGTATSGTDYQSLTGTVTFGYSQSTTTVSVDPLRDQIVREGLETVIVTVQSGSIYNADPSANEATVEISDALLPIITITVPDNEATEPLGNNNGMPGGGMPGQEDEETARFTVSRQSDDIYDPLVVHLNIDGTADNHWDYESIPETVTIPAYQTSVDIIVRGLHDQEYTEGTETIVASIAAGNGAELYNYEVGTPSSATVNLLESPPPKIRIRSTGPTGGEPGINVVANEFSFEVIREGYLDESLTVIVFLGGTARNGRDFGRGNPIPTTVHFDPGVESVTFVITPNADLNLTESSETAIVTVQDGLYYDVIPGQQQVTLAIENNPTPPASTEPDCDCDCESESEGGPHSVDDGTDPENPIVTNGEANHKDVLANDVLPNGSLFNAGKQCNYETSLVSTILSSTEVISARLRKSRQLPGVETVSRTSTQHAT